MARVIPILSLCASLWGCAHPPEARTAPAARDAHGLAFDALGCWFGPMWQDALGVAEDHRAPEGERLCRAVVARVWGGADRADYERLRALEPRAIDDLVARVKREARPDEGALPPLVLVAADVQRENLWVRRDADEVKRDQTGARANAEARQAPDERDALRSFAHADALRALVRAEDPDRRALGVLAAMDRIESARGLPRHLEIAAAAPALDLLFGTTAPTLPTDAGAEVAPHVWIDYLSRAAAQAGRPVPERAQGEARARLAWAALLDGVADRLAGAGATQQPLRAVVEGTVRRLRAEATGDRDWYATHFESR